MAFKIFLDANILLDLTLRRSNYDKAKKVFELVGDNKVKGYTTPSIIHILGHYITKSYDANIAKELILTLLKDILIIDMSHELVITALNSQMIDIEDSLQYYSALHHKMDYFISMDKQLRKSGIPGLPVLTPDELIALFN